MRMNWASPSSPTERRTFLTLASITTTASSLTRSRTCSNTSLYTVTSWVAVPSDRLRTTMRPPWVLWTLIDSTTPAINCVRVPASPSAEAAKIRPDEAPDLRAVRREGVAREIEAERSLLLAKALRLGPPGSGHERRLLLRTALARAEEAHLFRVALGLLGRLQRDPHRGEQARTRRVVARTHGIEGAGAHQRLDRTAVGRALVPAPPEVQQVPDRGALPRPADRGDRRFAGAFHRAQAVADRARVHRNEAVFARVDVGREHLQAVGDGVLVELMHLVGVVHHR